MNSNIAGFPAAPADLQLFSGQVVEGLVQALWPALQPRISQMLLASSPATAPGQDTAAPLLHRLPAAAGRVGMSEGKARQRITIGDLPVLDLSARLQEKRRERRIVTIPEAWLVSGSWMSMGAKVPTVPTPRESVSLDGWPERLQSGDVERALSVGEATAIRLVDKGGLPAKVDSRGYRLVARKDLEQYVWELIREAEIAWGETLRPAGRRRA